MTFTDTITALKNNPTAFFTDLKKRTSIGTAFLIALVFLVIVGIFEVIYQKLTMQSGAAVGISTIWLFVLVLIFGAAGLFAGTAINHVLLLIFRAKGTYANTFNTLIYGAIPSYVLGTIGYILFILVALIPQPVVQVVLGIIAFILVIVGTIFSLILQVKGLSIAHEISIGKVVIAIIVIPLAIAIILFVIFLAFFVAMMSMAAASGAFVV